MRHIPASESTEIDILSFEEALNLRSADALYDREKWHYIPDCYSEYRYILGTAGAHPLIAVGINPSTAAPNALDRTLQSVERIALHNGFDSFLMLNVYAQRATNPKQMDKLFNRKLHEENLRAFFWALRRAGDAPHVWAAWGTIVEQSEYLLSCMEDMVQLGAECGARWVKAGCVSKKGHPHHPLYLRSDSPLEPFDAKAYLSTIRGA